MDQLSFRKQSGLHEGSHQLLLGTPSFEILSLTSYHFPFCEGCGSSHLVRSLCGFSVRATKLQVFAMRSAKAGMDSGVNSGALRKDL